MVCFEKQGLLKIGDIADELGVTVATVNKTLAIFEETPRTFEVALNKLLEKEVLKRKKIKILRDVLLESTKMTCLNSLKKAVKRQGHKTSIHEIR